MSCKRRQAALRTRAPDPGWLIQCVASKSGSFIGAQRVHQIVERKRKKNKQTHTQELAQPASFNDVWDHLTLPLTKANNEKKHILQVYSLPEFLDFKSGKFRLALTFFSRPAGFGYLDQAPIPFRTWRGRCPRGIRCSCCGGRAGLRNLWPRNGGGSCLAWPGVQQLMLWL